MTAFLCSLWPLVLGALIGWLLAALLGRPLYRDLQATAQLVGQRDAELTQLRDEYDALRRKPAVERIVEKPVERIVEKPVERIVERLVPDTRGLEERDRQLRDWQTRYADLERRLAESTRTIGARDEEIRRLTTPPVIDVEAARAAGFTTLKGADDLEIIEGIGPKIAELLNQAGVHRFYELARMRAEQIQQILDAAGANFKLARPDTWPEQAELAARNRWRALRSLQDALVAGNRR